jgi:hypothetical protein
MTSFIIIKQVVIFIDVDQFLLCCLFTPNRNIYIVQSVDGVR